VDVTTLDVLLSHFTSAATAVAALVAAVAGIYNIFKGNRREGMLVEIQRVQNGDTRRALELAGKAGEALEYRRASAEAAAVAAAAAGERLKAAQEGNHAP
jgi:hypothetical protein